MKKSLELLAVWAVILFDLLVPEPRERWSWFRIFFFLCLVLTAATVIGMVFFTDSLKFSFFLFHSWVFLLACGVSVSLWQPIKKALDSPAVRWIARQAEWIARAGTALWFSATAILIWLKVFSRDSIPSDGYFVLGGGLAAIWAGCAVLRRWQTRPKKNRYIQPRPQRTAA